MKLNKVQKNKIASAQIAFGFSACRRAYELNVIQGEGGTVIEIETGIPQRNQASAILAGEYFTKENITSSVYNYSYQQV